MPGGRHLGWHSRGYLPHFDGAGVIQVVTYRLADAMPRSVIESWRRDLDREVAHSDQARALKLLKQIRKYEDAGHGACLLRIPECAEIVQQNLLHFDADRYHLFDWCIMPNHLHVMISVAESHPLDRVVKSWKCFTAKLINQHLNRSGPLWEREYHDRYIRNAEHFENARHYIRQNPVHAGLCDQAEAWPWSSASRG